MASDDDDAELLLVRQLPMEMDNDGQGSPARRLAHLLPPLALAPGPPPFRPPPPLAAAASAESRVSFRGWLGAPRHWDLWVTKLRPIHHRLWRKLGILDAVLASTYRFKRDASALLNIASFWSPDTNTFTFPWGEATLTLHDVAVLGGFPAHGSPPPAPLPPQWRPDEATLNGVRLGFNRSACKKAHHSAWVKHFLTDTATDAVVEHAAFLALWLTRFVLPGHPESTMRQSVFPLAVRLAHGERVALGPAVLASLYRDLREMKVYLVAAGAAATGGNAELLSPLSVYAPVYILQLWVWERFPALWAGKVNPIKDGEPRAARWHDVSKKMNPTVLREVLSSGKNFVWQPYTSSVQAWKQHSGWVRSSDVAGNEELRSLAHCLHACELVGIDCIEQYLPQRVAMQFGLDQDVPSDVHRANEDWAVAWETYDLEGKNVAFFIPQSEPGLTARYAHWWRQPLSPSDLDPGAASIAVECKVSKRKVKKTLAAMEAEAEKERKMKKVRISPNDKKRKLEELYDAKLSDWLAVARNGSSGTGGGSCKRGSSPKSDTGSDKALSDDVETIKDSIVLLVPRKQTTPPAVKPKKDKNMNPAIGDKGNFIDNSLVKMKEKGVKGNWTGDVHHPVNQPLCKEKRAAVSTEISTFTKDYAAAEWSGMILKNTNELVRGETPDVSNRPEEAKPPAHMEKEEASDHLSDGCCKEAAIEEVVTVDKLRDISNGPESGVMVTLEEKRPNFHVDKSLDVTDRPEEGATTTLELEKGSNHAVDESCGVSNRPEEVAAPVMKEKEKKVATEEVLAVMEMNPTEKNIVVVREADDGNAVSEEVERAADGVADSIEVAPQSKEEIDAGVINNCPDANALPQEVLPILQANHLGECIEMSHIMEDGNVVAGVLGTNDGETTCCDIVAKDQGEVPCVEAIGGGESNQMVEKDSKEKPQEAPQAEIVECRELIITMEKDNENESKKVPLIVEEGEYPEVDKTLNLAKKDTEEMPMEVTEVEEAEQEQISTLTKGGAGEEQKEVPQIEHIDMEEPKVHEQFDTEKHGEVAGVESAEMDGTDKLTGNDTDRKPGDVSEIGNAEMEKARVLIEKDTDEKLADVSEVEDAEVEELKGLMKEGTDKKFEEVPELGNVGMGGTHGTTEEDADGKLNGAPDVIAEVEQPNGLEMGNDRPEGILQVDLPESGGDAKWLAKEDTEDNTTEVPQVNHEKLRDETPIVGHISEKPSAYGEDLPEKDVNESEEVYQAEQVEGEDCKVLREKDTEEETKDALGVEQEEGQGKALVGKDIHDYVGEITVVGLVDPKEPTLAQGKEIDKDMMEASNNSIRGKISCNSASIQSKGKQKEASDEGIVEKQCIQDVELINERELPSDAAAMKVEGVDDHKTLDMHEEVATKMIQDRGIICENKEMRILEDSHKLDSGLKSDLVILEVDETQDTERIQIQENLDLDKQHTMEERQDLGTTVENKKMEISEDANMLVCCEFQTDSPGMDVNEVESTKEIQNQEHSDIKEVMEKRLESVITDGNERPLEEANTVGSSAVDTISFAVDVSEANSVKGMQNQEACSTEESQAREEKQHHGVGNVNKKRILGDTTTIDSGELKSDATIVGVDGAESREGTRNQWALSMAKEPAMQGKLDQGTADENIKRILVYTDDTECGGVKPDMTMKMAHDILPTGQVDIEGDKISSKGVPWEDHNKSDIEGSESNQTARKEFKGALPPEFENQVVAKQEKLENKIEMSIAREDEASEQDRTSTEDATIGPSGTADQGENNKEWAEESIKSYGKYTSDPVNTACQPSKLCRPSIEEVRRIHSGRSICLKDTKESQGRIRSEPSNRVHINNVWYYSRHAVQEPVSVSKDIKVPLHDSLRVCGRDRAPDLVVTGPPEETSRWRQEQYALQILEDVQSSRIAEKTRMEMEIRILKAQIASMQRQVMNMDHVGEVISRSKRH